MLKIRYIGEPAIIVGQKTYYKDETFELTEAGFKLLKKTVSRKDLKVLSELTETDDDEGDTLTQTPAEQASDQGATVLADVDGKPEEKRLEFSDGFVTSMIDMSGKETNRTTKATKAR